MRDFVHFSQFLPNALKRYSMTRQARASLICQRFRALAPSVIGEDAQETVHPKFFKGRTLFVSVPSSVWAQRVYVHRHDLIIKLNLDLDKDWVHEIRTVVEGQAPAALSS